MSKGGSKDCAGIILKLSNYSLVATGLHLVRKSQIQANVALVTDALQAPNKTLIISATVGAVVIIAVAIALLFLIWRRRRNRRDDSKKSAGLIAELDPQAQPYLFSKTAYELAPVEIPAELDTMQDVVHELPVTEESDRGHEGHAKRSTDSSTRVLIR